MEPRYRQFLTALLGELSDDSPDWLAVWELWVHDPCSQTVFEQQLRLAARDFHLSTSQIDDLRQESLLELGCRLRRRPHLGLDPARAEHHFPGWLHLVVRRLVRRTAGRRLLRHEAGSCPFQESSCSSRAMRSRLELMELIGQLPAEQQVCLMLVGEGFQHREIAERLKTSVSRVRRLLRHARESLAEQEG